MINGEIIRIWVDDRFGDLGKKKHRELSSQQSRDTESLL